MMAFRARLRAMSAPASEVTSRTPILDRIVPLPKMEGTAARTGIMLAVWFGIVMAAAIVYVFWHPPFVRAGARWILSITGAMAPLHWTGDAAVFYVFFLLTATFTAIAVHELSHALVGVLVGFRFNSLRVGRLQFDRPFRITLYRGKGTGSGGWASLFPVKQDKLILRAIAMLLAGPLSNLASICMLVLLPYSKGMFSALFIYISLFLGLMNLVPFRGRAVVSDGGRILMLLKNRARGERWLAMLKLLEEMRTGVPPEKMTPEFIAKATAIEDKSPDTVVAFALAYATAFWQRKDDEAAQALETCLRHSSLAAPSQRQGLMSDAAIFQAHRRKRIDLAEQWLADIPQKTEFPWLRPRGEVAILGARGDIGGALKKLDEIEKLVLAVPNEALREISLRGVKRWRAELQA
jgi:hypothetical protein